MVRESQGRERIGAHLQIHGRVQGVGYRYFVQETAEQLGLPGWVRNLPDGTVEAVFEGSPAAVERAVEFCRRGPRGAHVEGIEVRLEQPEGLKGFHEQVQ